VGAYLARTAFIAFLDDDDELAVGAGKSWAGARAGANGSPLPRCHLALLTTLVPPHPAAGDTIRNALASRPEVDVWVPGIQYTDGRCVVPLAPPAPPNPAPNPAPAPLLPRILLNVPRPRRHRSKCTANCLAFSGDDSAHARCMQQGGLVESNVCVPIYRTSVFSVVPFTHKVVIGGEKIFMGGTLLPHTVYLVDFNHVKACKQHGFAVEWLSSTALYLVRPHHSGFHGSESAKGIRFEERAGPGAG